jgi:glycosyltransferase involved in cell wall biosynthesis
MLTNSRKKIKVLIFIGHYLPGFKSGGILRSVENTVNNLAGEFEFSIITRDNDLGEKESYSEININQWQSVGRANVFYLDDKTISFSKICDLINNTPHDIIYLNSFFEPLSIKVLFAKKTGKIGSKPIILSPRGEFGWASLKLKYPKKLLYMIISRFFHLYNNIIWHASTKIEKNDITKRIKIDPARIHVARDLPIKSKQNLPYKNKKPTHDLRIIFLSRISPEKNLDYALKVLSKVSNLIIFDIYGSAENKNYWKKCQQLITKLPDNIKVSYCGELEPQNVVDILSNYDLLLFPSGGENYGHVIAESLSAGTPVLISDNTPWLGLEEKNLGWDIDLKNMDCFIEIINKVALMSPNERESKRDYIRNNINGILFNKQDYEDNRQLYLQAFSRG